MASVTMTASFFAGATLADRSSATTHRKFIITSSAKAKVGERVKLSHDESKNESSRGRRDLMFAAAAAAAAVCSVAGVAVAGEPKPGSPEAKKIYAPICVTMPTARICRR